MSTRTIPSRPTSASGGEPPWRDDENDRDEGGFTPPPRQPRHRLVTPATGAIAAVLVAALGFLGGVEVQKHSGSSSTTGASGNPPSVASGSGAPSGGPPSGGLPGGGQPGGQSGQGTTGTVSYVKHGVIYVKDSDGNTVKVKVSDSTVVTRTAATTAGKVHPGDAVTIQGKTSGATVTASSLTATAADN